MSYRVDRERKTLLKTALPSLRRAVTIINSRQFIIMHVMMMTVRGLLAGFPYNKLHSRTVYLQVMDYDRFCRDDPIGEICVPLSDVDLLRGETLNKTLQPCKGHTVSDVRYSVKAMNWTDMTVRSCDVAELAFQFSSVQFNSVHFTSFLSLGTRLTPLHSDTNISHTSHLFPYFGFLFIPPKPSDEGRYVFWSVDFFVVWKSHKIVNGFWWNLVEGLIITPKASD